MTRYEDAGVNIDRGDSASRSAYIHAATTFANRRGRIGAPVFEEGGFAGFLDFGDFYIVMSDDGTGTKIDVAHAMNSMESLGYDLVAMVADDIVCCGAEVIALSNTIDTARIEPEQIDAMMHGLAEACSAQKIVIPAGEIAEVPGAVHRAVWSATAIGIVAKDRVIAGADIQIGDAVIALRDPMARSNGFSLIRKILGDVYGEQWYDREWQGGTTWGQIILTPSTVYHAAILSLIGRYGEKRAVNVKGIAHITGGGIGSKFRRTLKASGLGASLTNLFTPHEALQEIISLGQVATDEAYRTWHMGQGMLVVCAPGDAERVVQMLGAQNLESRIAGIITQEPEIRVSAWDGTEIVFA